MAVITQDRATIESMLSSVRANAGDPLDPPSPALLSAQLALIDALEEARTSDKPSGHEEACQAAWAAFLAHGDDDSMIRWGAPSGNRAASIRKTFSDTTQKAVAAAEHLMAATSVYGLAERTPAWTEAVDEWLSFVGREVPGDGDHAWDRFTACHQGCRRIEAAWHGGTTAMLGRIDPTRREGPRPMASTVSQWWAIYHAAAAAFIRLKDTEAEVRIAERAWGLARAKAARASKSG